MVRGMADVLDMSLNPAQPRSRPPEPGLRLGISAVVPPPAELPAAERRRSTREHGQHLDGVAAVFWSPEELRSRAGAAGETSGRGGEAGLSSSGRNGVSGRSSSGRRRGRAQTRPRLRSSAADGEGGLSFFWPRGEAGLSSSGRGGESGRSSFGRQRGKAQIHPQLRSSAADGDGAAEARENDDGSDAAVGGSAARRPADDPQV